jgi:hypothetical protein
LFDIKINFICGHICRYFPTKVKLKIKKSDFLAFYPLKSIVTIILLLFPEMLMKKQTYLDYISNYLDEQAFEQFKATYQQKISKSIKIIEKRIQKSDFFSLVKRY